LRADNNRRISLRLPAIRPSTIDPTLPDFGSGASMLQIRDGNPRQRSNVSRPESMG
jgi:hypothetical protein